MSINSYTSKGFKLINFNSDDWHGEEWSNWQLLDALLDASFDDVALPVVGGTANAITLNYTPDKPIVNGTTLLFQLTAAPTGATTIQVDGGALIPLKILDNPVVAGSLLDGDIVRVVYDGTSFQVLSPIRGTYSAITVTTGVSGATAAITADDVIVQNSDDAGISILTPNNKKGAILFGDPENASAGGIVYDHATNKYTLYVDGVATAELGVTGWKLLQGYFSFNLNGINDLWIKEVSNDVVRIGSSGSTNGFSIDITTGFVTFHNDLIVTGNVDFNGNVDLGTNVTVDGLTTTDDIIRSGKGIHPFYNDPLMVGGAIFVQAIGADPTANPGDIVFEY